MSLGSVIRSRFRKSETFGGNPNKETNSISSTPTNELSINEELNRSQSMSCMAEVIKAEEELRTPVNEGLLLSEDSTFQAMEQLERDTMEAQNKELQMQLLSATIANQNLMEELKNLKERKIVEKLEKELHDERKRCEKLLEKLGSKKDGLRRHRTMFSRKQQLIVQSHSDEDRQAASSHLSSSNESLAAPRGSLDKPPPSDQPRGLWQSCRRYVVESWRNLKDDFMMVEDYQDTQEDPDGEAFSPRRLKDNITRFRRAFGPISSCYAGYNNLVAWKRPTYSLCVAVMFAYSVWTGWQLPLVIGLALVRLMINYLRYRRGWAINVRFLRDYDNEQTVQERDTKMSAQINFVLLVARKCQNFAGQVADYLEKLNNMFMWRSPQQAKKVMQTLLIMLVVSSCLSIESFVFLASCLLVMKLFLVNFIYMRFPRLRRHDELHAVWLALPTDSEYANRTTSRGVEKYILHHPEEEPPDSPNATLVAGEMGLSGDNKTFCEIFSLPYSECPLPSWKSGKRCMLLNKEKSLSNAFKAGKLYLTRSFLCFERLKSKDKKSRRHAVIPLRQILKVQKAKPFSWIPGAGMTLEITVRGLDKPLLFGCVSRDEIFESMMQAARNASLPWAAMGPPTKSQDSASTSASAQETEEKEEDTDTSLLETIHTALVEDSDSD